MPQTPRRACGWSGGTSQPERLVGCLRRPGATAQPVPVPCGQASSSSGVSKSPRPRAPRSDQLEGTRREFLTLADRVIAAEGATPPVPGDHCPALDRCEPVNQRGDKRLAFALAQTGGGTRRSRSCSSRAVTLAGPAGQALGPGERNRPPDRPRDRGTEGFGTKSGARACFCWSKGLLPDVQYDGRFSQPGNPTRP